MPPITNTGQIKEREVVISELNVKTNKILNELTGLTVEDARIVLNGAIDELERHSILQAIS